LSYQAAAIVAFSVKYDHVRVTEALHITLIRLADQTARPGVCVVCSRRDVGVRPALRVGEVVGDMRAGVPWLAICEDCWRACEGLLHLAGGSALTLDLADPGDVLPPYRA
jgi:hypothetical protein